MSYDMGTRLMYLFFVPHRQEGEYEMFIKSKRWQYAITAVIAALCLTGSGQKISEVKATGNSTDTIVKLDEKLGVAPGAVLSELQAHENDGYYLGTPYTGSPLTPENCMRPNGAYDGNGGMNCTGFVAYVLEKCGADLSGIANRGYRGGKVNASNWYHWITENSVEYYHYDTIDELLAGGKAQKGDVIYFEPISWESEDADCHIGFFWGNNGKDNAFWHSSTHPSRGNQISVLEAKCKSTVYPFKITHTGDLEVKKSSGDVALVEGNSSYSLKGAEFTVYQKGTQNPVAVIVTDEKGYGKAEGLPAGTYDIKETKAPKGYALNLEVKSVTVKAGETVCYTCEDQPFYNPVEMVIEKIDSETGNAAAQGKATLAGAEFLVKYYDKEVSGNLESQEYQPVRTWKFMTDEEGKVKWKKEYLTEGDSFYEKNGQVILPLGTITVQEIKAPEGYQINDQIFIQNITAKSTQEAAKLHIFQTVKVEEKILRGDLELIKVADGTMKRLSGIPFRITSRTTGESHRIITDKNGYASTSAKFNLHTTNTNRGESSEDGIWFGGGNPENESGALPYDTYFVEELECENNSDRILLPAIEVEITKDNNTVNLGTLTNDKKPMPEISTTAIDRDSGSHEAVPRENMILIDQVLWENLTPRKEYVLKGILMDGETGEELLIGGEKVTAEKVFVPEEEAGNVDVQFEFDASGLGGRTTVVFEELYCEDKLIAVHADIEDEGQSIQFEEIPEEPELPEEPEEPEKPEEPKTETPKEINKPETVTTGDSANLIVLIICALLSCAVVVKCVRISRRK